MKKILVTMALAIILAIPSVVSAFSLAPLWCEFIPTTNSDLFTDVTVQSINTEAFPDPAVGLILVSKMVFELSRDDALMYGKDIQEAVVLPCMLEHVKLAIANSLNSKGLSLIHI
jgi:hypothetical protein